MCVWEFGRGSENQWCIDFDGSFSDEVWRALNGWFSGGRGGQGVAREEGLEVVSTLVACLIIAFIAEPLSLSPNEHTGRTQQHLFSTSLPR